MQGPARFSSHLGIPRPSISLVQCHLSLSEIEFHNTCPEEHDICTDLFRYPVNASYGQPGPNSLFFIRQMNVICHFLMCMLLVAGVVLLH